MNIKSTLVGILVLALVATGVLWVRSRTTGTDTPPDGQSTPSSAARAARTAAAGDEELPDVTRAEGTAQIGAVRITLLLSPNPPVAFASFRAQVRTELSGAPVALEGGRVSFEMAMPMGDHHYTLVPGADGWQEAAVVLPT